MEIIDRVGRKDECPHCSGDLHICLHCKFYDPGSYNDCRESSADLVKDKERSNFCDYFEPGRSQDKGPAKDDLLAAAEALFKK